MRKLSDDELLEEIKMHLKEKEKTLQELIFLSDELKKANKKLAQSEALKSHFLANIRNEILNPFSSIIGLSQHITRVDKEDWKKVIKMAALIHSEAFELNFQLKNIFAAAEIEAGELHPQYSRVDICSILREIIDEFSPILTRKLVEIDLQDELSKENETFIFITDPTQFELILSNLVKNAIEFSPENSIVTIKTWYAEPTNDLKIEIIDKGIGIPPTKIPAIFDRFSRLENTISSKVKGQGLGLSIIKSLLDLLNGSIDVKSQVEMGTSFLISLPKNDNAGLVESTATKSNEVFFDGEEMF
jgi:signal transduction histidine kinase